MLTVLRVDKFGLVERWDLKVGCIEVRRRKMEDGCLCLMHRKRREARMLRRWKEERKEEVGFANGE